MYIKSMLKKTLCMKNIFLTNIHFLISNKSIKQWKDNKNIFFVLAIGRSGTTFLAKLLNNSKDNYVVHEPVINDFSAYQKAFYSLEEAYKYIEKFRIKEIFLRTKNKKFQTYGEVNSLLRRHYKPLKENFNNAVFIHLIRDGRDVVRSMYSNMTMSHNDINTRNIHPHKNDKYYNRWSEMNRFEKLCWYWAEENKFLRKNIKIKVRFEDIISDYEIFHNKLINNININISKNDWENTINKPKNTTSNHKLPHWTNWDKNKINTFNEICGNEMKKNGYKI